MKKFLLSTTIALMTGLTVQAQNVSQDDIEKYLQAHPEAIQNYINNQKNVKPSKKPFLENAQSAPFSVVDEITHNPQFYSLGNPEGTFVIIEFFDYQCGWCKRSNTSLTKMLSSPKAKNIRFIPVPTPIFGEASETIAKYVLAAGKQGKFAEMHKTVFERTGRKSENDLLDIAQSIGLDTERLQKDAHSDDINQVLSVANGYKSKMSISGVPMFIVNGKIKSGAILDDKAEEILALQGTTPIFAGDPNISVVTPTREAVVPPPVKEPAVQKPEIAARVMTVIGLARQKGIIQSDGLFEIKEEGVEIAGKLSCSDAELDENLKRFDADLSSTNPDTEKLRQTLDKVLRCVSFSKLNIQNKNITFSLTGSFKFPFFEDKSVATIKFSDKVITVAFGLKGSEQDVTVEVHNNRGEKLSYISLQYDADKLSVPFELGLLFGLMDYIKGTPDLEMKITRQMQIWAQENNLLLENAARIKKAEIYQPDGKKVLILNGEDEKRSILRVFSSIEREFVNALWTNDTLKLNVSFPKSSGKLLETDVKFSPNFQENYRKFMMKVSQNPNDRPDAEIAQMLSGMKLEITLYGLDGQPLTRLKAKLNDQITSPNRPEEIMDYAALTILKPSAGCTVRSMSFAKANPNVLTLCGSNGCSDQSFFSAMEKLSPCLERETEEVFKKFGEEVKEELKKMEKVYIPGVSDGYNLAMNRYRANEILNATAMVAVAATSKDGGMGGDADLSDLGGIRSLNIEGITSDKAIRGNKNGVVTIELEPDLAKELFPIISNLSGNRVTSGCTADTTTCVIDMARHIK